MRPEKEQKEPARPQHPVDGAQAQHPPRGQAPCPRERGEASPQRGAPLPEGRVGGLGGLTREQRGGIPRPNDGAGVRLEAPPPDLVVWAEDEGQQEGHHREGGAGPQGGRAQCKGPGSASGPGEGGQGVPQDLAQREGADDDRLQPRLAGGAPGVGHQRTRRGVSRVEPYVEEPEPCEGDFDRPPSLGQRHRGEAERRQAGTEGEKGPPPARPIARDAHGRLHQEARGGPQEPEPGQGGGGGPEAQQERRGQRRLERPPRLRPHQRRRGPLRAPARPRPGGRTALPRPGGAPGPALSGDPQTTGGGGAGGRGGWRGGRGARRWRCTCTT